jgi:hypothetical protein
MKRRNFLKKLGVAVALAPAAPAIARQIDKEVRLAKIKRGLRVAIAESKQAMASNIATDYVDNYEKTVRRLAGEQRSRLRLVTNTKRIS